MNKAILRNKDNIVKFWYQGVVKYYENNKKISGV